MNNNITIQQFNNYFAFVLGREQKIALYELESVLRRFGVCFSILSLLENIAIIKMNAGFSDQISVVSLMQLLGGTVKIYEISNIQYPISNEISNNQYQIVQSQIVDKLLENKSNGTLNFGVSDYSGTFNERELKKLGIEIKKEARKTRPVRFVEGSGVELSSATSYHKIYKTGGEEFGIFDANLKFKIQNLKLNLNSKLKIENFLIGRLIATTNPDEWSDRDYGKPAGDKFSGMMPPKLARMMVNIVLGENRKSKVRSQNCNSKLKIGYFGIEHSLKIENCPEGPELVEGQIDDLNDLVVFDPFCGSGNILMEALLLGCEVIGSDISEKAVEDTRANLHWLISNNQFPTTNEISNSKFQSVCHSELVEESHHHVSGSKNEVGRSNNSTIQQYNNDSVFKADATKEELAEKLNMILPNKLTPNAYKLVIVTEPYLGKPKKVKVNRLQVLEETNKLKNIYLNFFKNITNLKPGTYNLKTICFVFPLIETVDSGTISLYDECVDELRQMGYNTTRTLRYGRDYQVVKRDIVLLTLK